MMGLRGMFSNDSTRIRYSCVQNPRKLAYRFRYAYEFAGNFKNKRLPSEKHIDTPWEIAVLERNTTDRKIHLMEGPSDATSNQRMMRSNPGLRQGLK
jgi:hypothetical protein